MADGAVWSATPTSAAYWRDPSFDPDLQGFFRAMGGTGWVTKVPHGDAALYIHLREIPNAEFKSIRRALAEDLTPLPDDPGHPVDAGKAGLYLRATFLNTASTPFVRWWGHSQRTFDLLLGMSYDLEDLWLPRFRRRDLLHGKLPADLRQLLDGIVEVPPGGRVEKLLRFRPEESPRDLRIHPRHVQFITCTVPCEFGGGFRRSSPAPVPVAFPFYAPTQQPTNAVASLEVAIPPDADKGGFIVVPTHLRFTAGGDVWLTTGIASAPVPAGAAPSTLRVPAIRTTPGTASSTADGMALRFRPVAAGFRYPKGVTVRVAGPPTGGSDLGPVEGWTPYSFREERAAEAAWDAIPDPEKVRQLVELLANADPEIRQTALRRLARVSNELALPPIVAAFQDPDPLVRSIAQSAYRSIVGMSYDQHLAMIEAQRSQENYFIELARKHGRITNVTIQDSVLQSTKIDLGDHAGSVKISIHDSVLSGSTIGGAKKEGGRPP